MLDREGSNPGPRLWYQVRAPHLANPTIKPRCYSGRGGGFYPQSNRLIICTICLSKLKSYWNTFMYLTFTFKKIIPSLIEGDAFCHFWISLFYRCHTNFCLTC